MLIYIWTAILAFCFALFVFWLAGKYQETANDEIAAIAQMFEPIDALVAKATSLEDCQVAAGQYIASTGPYFPPLQGAIPESRRDIEPLKIQPEMKYFANIAFQSGLILASCVARLRSESKITTEEIVDFLKGTADKFPSQSP